MWGEDAAILQLSRVVTDVLTPLPGVKQQLGLQAGLAFPRLLLQLA